MQADQALDHARLSPARPLGAPRGLPPALTVVVVLALAMGVRVWGLQAQSLSMDEVFELRLAAQPVDAIVTSGDGFPPLYHLVAHWWLRLADAGSLRYLSVVLGLLTIVAIRQLGRLSGGERVGTLSALFLAISPLHIWFSQEARAYVLYCRGK